MSRNREHPVLDPIAYALSSAADHGMLWLAIGALRAAWKGEPVIALRLAAILTAESALTNGLVKSVFRRIRPELDRGDGALPYGMHRPITTSFPSGHATSAFTAALVLSKDSSTTLGLLALATTVAATRVHVRMHHTSDVVAGAALGLALGAIARRLLPLEGER